MERHGYEIRRAGPDDVAAIRQLVRDAYAIYVSRIGQEPAPMRADYGALVRERAVTVAVEHGRIVGALVLRRQPPGSLLLENVAVGPADQGRGIGRALIAFAEECARELNLNKVTLFTNVKMTENRSLYRRLGYVELGRRREHGFERVFFEKALTPSKASTRVG